MSIDDEITALHRIGGRVPRSPEHQHSYYRSEQFKQAQEYFSSAGKSKHFTFKDFCFILKHTYHDPALPPLGFWRLAGIFGWVVMIVWGIFWLCS